MTEKTASKNPSVSVGAFIKAVAEGRKANKSNKEIAESLGMKPTSFNVRVANENRNLCNATAMYEIGSGKSKRTLIGHQVAAEFRVPVSKLHTAETLEKIGAKIVTEGKRLPGSTASRGPGNRTDWSEIAGGLFGETE